MSSRRSLARKTVDRGSNAFDVELAVLPPELHEVERGEVGG
jgi:hypothetical protein